MNFKIPVASYSSSESAVMRSTMTDIFPIHVSRTAPNRLHYPDKYHQLMDSKDVKVFVLYMDSSKKIYYHKRRYADKYVEHVKSVAKEIRHFQDFRPNDINFCTVASRFKRSTKDTHRKNMDTRVGYKIGNSYLVKTYFTFGQRTVEPGTAHVYQVLDVPLLFFLMEDKTKLFKANLQIRNRLFPYEDLHLYDRRILLANTVYRVPPGTTYLIFTTQKNFFSIDVVEESTRLPYAFEDPVKTRVTKLEQFSPYEVPVQTPFIGADDRFDDDERYPTECNSSHSSAAAAAATMEPSYYEWFVFHPQPLPEQTVPEQIFEEPQQISVAAAEPQQILTAAAEPQQISEEPRQISEEPQQISAAEPQQILEEPHQTCEEPQQTCEEPQQTCEEPQQTCEEPQQILPEPQQISLLPEPQQISMDVVESYVERQPLPEGVEVVEPALETLPPRDPDLQIVEVRNTVMVASQDIVQNYRKLQEKLYGDPRMDFGVIEDSGSEACEPMDLSVFRPEDLEMPDQQLQRLLDEFLMDPPELSLGSEYINFDELMSF